MPIRFASGLILRPSLAAQPDEEYDEPTGEALHGVLHDPYYGMELEKDDILDAQHDEAEMYSYDSQDDLDQDAAYHQERQPHH